VIRALIILECVLLMIVAFDRIVGVSMSGGTIEQAGPEPVMSRDVSRDGQAGSMRAAIAPPTAVVRPGVPPSGTLDETAAKPWTRTKPVESSILSTAASQTPLPAAASR
jgi:hypothetical protein